MSVPTNMVRSSLLSKVFLRVGLTMFAAVVLVVVILVVEFMIHMDTLHDRSLNGQAGDIARHLNVNAEGDITVSLPTTLARAYQRKDAQYHYVVVDEQGQVLAASPGISVPLHRDDLETDSPVSYFKFIDPNSGYQHNGASLRHETALGTVYIQVQQDIEHDDVLVDSFLDELGEEVLWILLLIFGAILAVTFFTLRNALAPLHRVSAHAAAIGPSTLDQRLPMEDVPAEIHPLLLAVNSSLDRLQMGFQQQQRFVADAAHEIRTPIAILRAHLGSLELESGKTLERDLGNLERVVSQLLKLAQVDSFVIGNGEKAELNTVAVNAAALMGPIAIAAGKSIAVTGDTQCSIVGDADVLEVAVRNLIENALNHSPEDSEIEIQVTNGPQIRVLDRGPGVAAADREHIFDRFWRKDRSQASGAGLGLAIVSRIAALHDATITVEDRPDGGAIFVLTFRE